MRRRRGLFRSGRAGLNDDDGLEPSNLERFPAGRMIPSGRERLHDGQP